MKMINKPLKIVCTDIYLRFPEIMEDEYKDLIEFIEDNNIVYKSVSNKFKEQEQEIDQLNKIIKETLYYLEIDMIGTAIDKLKELKEEGKDNE